MQAWRTETYTKWLAGLLRDGQAIVLLGATASPALSALSRRYQPDDGVTLRLIR